MSIRSTLRALASRMGYTVHGGPCESSHILRTGELLRRLGPTHVLDVGGAVGEYAATLRNLGYRGPIHSFEPMPDNRSKLAARAASDPLWSVHLYALGEEDGTAPLNRITGHSCHSFYPPNRYGAETFGALAVEERVQVEVRRLDSLWSSLIGDSRRVWLKVDAEGHDLAVLAGAGDRIERVAALTCELFIHPVRDGVPTFGTVVEHVLSRGFEPYSFDAVVQDRQGRVMGMDGLFIRPDALA